jgi:hypothetical protein
MDELEIFRRMLDPKNWPVSDSFLIFEGEVWDFLPSTDPFEERICKPLFWKFQ